MKKVRKRSKKKSGDFVDLNKNFFKITLKLSIDEASQKQVAKHMKRIGFDDGGSEFHRKVLFIFEFVTVDWTEISGALNSLHALIFGDKLKLDWYSIEWITVEIDSTVEREDYTHPFNNPDGGQGDIWHEAKGQTVILEFGPKGELSDDSGFRYQYEYFALSVRHVLALLALRGMSVQIVDSPRDAHAVERFAKKMIRVSERELWTKR